MYRGVGILPKLEELVVTLAHLLAISGGRICATEFRERQRFQGEVRQRVSVVVAAFKILWPPVERQRFQDRFRQALLSRVP